MKTSALRQALQRFHVAECGPDDEPDYDAARGAVEAALGTEVSPEERTELERFVSTLPTPIFDRTWASPRDFAWADRVAASLAPSMNRPVSPAPTVFDAEATSMARSGCRLSAAARFVPELVAASIRVFVGNLSYEDARRSVEPARDDYVAARFACDSEPR